MDHRIENWKRQLKYLPAVLDNFDKMKTLFRFLHTCIGAPDGREVLETMNYRNSTIYIVDIFLWVMADYGYTLQRNRLKNANFSCIQENIHKLYSAVRANQGEEIEEIINQKVSDIASKYRENARHLPSFMRDFHDQKLLFNMINSLIDSSEKDHILNTVNPYYAHIYTIDYFLFIMFKYGYSLQKSRMKFNFLSIENDMKDYRSAQNQNFKNLLLKENS